jgi:hypothetical protein
MANFLNILETDIRMFESILCLPRMIVLSTLCITFLQLLIYPINLFVCLVMTTCQDFEVHSKFDLT